MVEAFLLAVETVIIYNANKAYSKSKACLVLGVSGAFCIGVVGVVNEEECNPVHSSKESVSRGATTHACVFLLL